MGFFGSIGIHEDTWTGPAGETPSAYIGNMISYFKGIGLSGKQLHDTAMNAFQFVGLPPKWMGYARKSLSGSGHPRGIHFSGLDRVSARATATSWTGPFGETPEQYIEQIIQQLESAGESGKALHNGVMSALQFVRMPQYWVAVARRRLAGTHFSGLGSFGVTAAAAARKAAAAAKAIARQSAAAQKQLTAAQGKANQTVALQSREAGLQAKITALQSGETVKQAAAAQRAATAAAKTSAKAAAKLPSAMTPYVVTPPSTTPGAGYTQPGAGATIPGVLGPGQIQGPGGYAIRNPSIPIPQQSLPMPSGGGYSGGGGMAPPPMGGGSYGGGPPATGGYTITQPTGGYAIGGPQAAPGAYTPMQAVSPGYSVGPMAPNLTTLVPQSPYGTAIGPTPYAGSYSVQAPSGAAYGIGALGGGITNYTTPRQGDTKACTNKRTALSKAYQKALTALQKNPNSKAMTNFQKRYPKLVTALQKKCPQTGIVQPGIYPGYPQTGVCPQGFSQNPAFNPSLPRSQVNPLCVFGAQPGYPQYPGYPGGFQPPPNQPSFYPGGSGMPQPGETVWQGGGYQGGNYTLSPEGAPYAGMAPSSTGYGSPPGSAIIGPMRVDSSTGYSQGAGYANVPIQNQEDVFGSGASVDPNVLAMSDSDSSDEADSTSYDDVLATHEMPTGKQRHQGTPHQFESSDFSGLGKHHHHGGSGRGLIMPIDYGGYDEPTVILIDNRECSPEDESCNPIGLAGLGARPPIGRSRKNRSGSKAFTQKKRTLPLLGMRKGHRVLR